MSVERHSWLLVFLRLLEDEHVVQPGSRSHSERRLCSSTEKWERRERHIYRGRKRRLYSWRPLHYQFRYGTVFVIVETTLRPSSGTPPRASSSPLLTDVLSPTLFLVPSSLFFSFSLPPYSFYPPIFLSSATCSLSSLLLFSLPRDGFLYKALYFPLARSLGEPPPPSTTLLLLPPPAPSAFFFPFPWNLFHEGRSFLRIYTCWTSLARFNRSLIFLFE